MNYKLFGIRLRELRNNRQISIKQLASQLGYTYTHISNVEIGYKKPSRDFVQKAADFFKIDSEGLLLLSAEIPEDIMRILQRSPTEAPKYLRKRFKDKDEK